MSAATDKASANANIVAGCELIQGALQWYEANELTDEVTDIHYQAARLAARAEMVAGVSAGTFANPLDGGTPKS